MAWPQATDYNLAIQNPAVCFEDPELRQGEAAGLMGLPRPYSGGAADVYQMQCPGGKNWAVKCFTREVHGLHERYQAISDHLRSFHRAFMVEFRYLERGILVKGSWYPVVKMRWVEGATLNDFLREHLDKPNVLERLAQMWVRLAQELREAQMAHGDLQHGNVMLVPSKSGALALRLIDYDGMYVPELADKPSPELGHANYQHPDRLARTSYSADIDRFSHLVIYTALRCLRLGGRALWQKYDTGDNLLFRQPDFDKPRTSKLLPELWALGDRDVRLLLGHLVLASQSALERVPLLDEIIEPVPDRTAIAPVRPLTAADETRLRNLLTLPEGGTRLAGKAPTRPTSGATPAPSTGSGVPLPPLPAALTATEPAGPATAVLAPVLPTAVPAVPEAPDKGVPAWLAPAAIPVSAPTAIPVSGDTASVAAPLAVPAAPVAVVVPVPVLEVPPVPTLEVVAVPVKEDDTAADREKSAPILEVLPADEDIAEVEAVPSPVPRILLTAGAAVGGVLVLALLVWIVWPSRKGHTPPTPPPPGPALYPAPELTLRGGETRKLDVIVNRHGSTETLLVQVDGLPAALRAEGVVLRERDAIAHVPLTADMDAPDGTFPVVVSLWAAGEKLAEQRTTVRVSALPLPQLRPVENLTLRIGEARLVTFALDRRGRNEPLTAKMDGLPERVQQEQIVAPAGQESVSINLIVPAEENPGVHVVRLSLWLNGRKVDEKNLLVTLNRMARQPLLTLPKEVKLSPGGKAELRVLLDRQGNDQPVEIALDELPAGVTASPAKGTVPPALELASFELRAAESTAPGQQMVRVRARLAGKEIDQSEFTLSVQGPMAPSPMPAGGAEPSGSPPAQVVNIVTADQVQLTGTFYPGGKDRNGQCVLLLPDVGETRNSEGWVRLAEALQKRGHHVLAIDFRGHGDSTQVTRGFWQHRTNQQLLPKGAARVGKDLGVIRYPEFPDAYWPHLVDDIAAARTFLDTRHDLGEVNSSNLVLIGAGEGATLGLLWLAYEAHRQEKGKTGPGSSELHHVAGAVWLNLSVSLGRKPLDNMVALLLRKLAVSGERLPMYFVHGANDAIGGVQALTLSQQMSRNLAQSAVKVVPGTHATGMALLQKNLQTEKLVLDGVTEILNQRDTIPWADRDLVRRIYYWNLPGNLSILAKAAGQRVLTPVPVERPTFR